MPTNNAKDAVNFFNYCEAHPEQRFWQALRNWSGYNFIGVSRSLEEPYADTFYLDQGSNPDATKLKA